MSAEMPAVENCVAFFLQGVDTVKAYIPDAVWYDYETVGFLPPAETTVVVNTYFKNDEAASTYIAFQIIMQITFLYDFYK